MSKIFKAFEKGKAFIPFFTAGDPDARTTVELVKAAAKSGAGLVELGIPFSDPIADGPVIQAANLRAFASGTTTDRVFEMVDEIRKTTDIPLVFLTYLNPVYKYGYERFFGRCRDSGVDGVIVPDLPYEEKKEASDTASAYGVDVISLIAPTSRERIRKIAGDASGFLYVVSSMGVTGVRGEITTDLDAIVREIRAVTDVPAAIGFGVSTPMQAAGLSKIADGVIVGSAIVRIVEKYGRESVPYVADYIRSMKEAMENG